MFGTFFFLKGIKLTYDVIVLFLCVWYVTTPPSYSLTSGSIIRNNYMADAGS